MIVIFNIIFIEPDEYKAKLFYLYLKCIQIKNLNNMNYIPVSTSEKADSAV